MTKFTVEASLILLLVQLLLGMWANLFVSFPSPAPSVNPFDQIFFGGPVLLAGHIVTGIALGTLSIVGLVSSLFTRSRALMAAEACALISVVVAGESGIEFVLGGYQDDILSYSMTVGFVLLLAVYVYAIWRPGHLARLPPT